MPDRTDQRPLLDLLARYVLTHGLAGASLRPMAAAAGTSDRMLIYHFGSKDGLMRVLLTHLAQNMAERLGPALPVGAFGSEDALLGAVLTVMRAPEFRPYGRVWFDILAAAAGGSDLHREVGQGIAGLFLAWIAERHPMGPAAAPAALARIEGAILLDALGMAELANRAVGPVSR